jgi:hypothetical protein
VLSPTGDIAGGVGAIGWTLWEAVKRVVLLLISGMAGYWLLPAVVTGAFCVLVPALGEDSSGQSLRARVLLYLAMLAWSAPLYIPGWDWGRWITATGWMAVIVQMALPAQRIGGCLPLRAPSRPAGTAVWSHLTINKTLVFAVLLSTGLAFRVPECCINETGAPTGDLFRSFAGMLMRGSQSSGLEERP